MFSVAKAASISVFSGIEAEAAESPFEITGFIRSLWVRLERTYTMELTHVKHRLYRIPTFYRIFYPNR